MSLINLLPQDYYQRRQGRRTNVICVALFAVVMAGIVSASMVSRSKANETQSVMDNLDRSYAQAAQTISQMQTLTAQKQTMQKKKKRIEDLQDPVPKSIVLAVLTNARPDGVSLKSVTLDSRFDPPPKKKKAPAAKLAVKTTKKKNQAPPPPAAPAEPKVTVEIIGLAHTDFQVARYLANLTDSGLTRSVDLSYTQHYDPGKGGNGREVPEHLYGLREFRLKCLLKKSIDIQMMAKQWRLSHQNPIITEGTPDFQEPASSKLAQNVLSGTEK